MDSMDTAGPTIDTAQVQSEVDRVNADRRRGRYDEILLVFANDGELALRVPGGSVLVAADGMRGRILCALARLLYRDSFGPVGLTPVVTTDKNRFLGFPDRPASAQGA